MIKSQLEKILGYPLEATENPDFGDYSSNVALSHKPPREFAEREVERLRINKELVLFVDKIEVAGPGFINFWLTRSVLVSELEKIQKEGDRYGQSDSGKDKTVVVDYSAPNIAKPFGIGHLRSTIIGQSIYNLYKFLGYEVVGDNHLGDWGTQFGKLLYMIKSEGFADFDIAKLEELYVEFHELAERDKQDERHRDADVQKEHRVAPRRSLRQIERQFQDETGQARDPEHSQERPVRHGRVEAGAIALAETPDDQDSRAVDEQGAGEGSEKTDRIPDRHRCPGRLDAD